VVSPVTFAAGLRLAMVWILCVLPVGRAVSAESKSPPSETVSLRSVAEDSSCPIYALGNIHVRQLRPTCNETINVKFELHLRMPEAAPGPELENRLNRWTHRLHDQVITAVRNAETKDFTEPGLRRLQKMILLRINRLLKFSRVEEVYITRYEFVLL
jgi:flagellar basal body-associated protein FliL